jgi:hypothetical protein
VGQDLVQHLWQNERVDDVTAQLERFGKHPQNLAEESGRASEARDVCRGICVKRPSTLSFRPEATWKNRTRADRPPAAKRILLWEKN